MVQLLITALFGTVYLLEITRNERLTHPSDQLSNDPYICLRLLLVD